MGKFKNFVAEKLLGFQVVAQSAGSVGLFTEAGWTTSGANIPIDDKSALAVSTNWNCQNGISRDVAQLPFKMLRYSVNDAGLETRTVIPDNPIAKIFQHSFNPRMAAYTGKAMLERWKLGIGNAYAEIVRSGNDIPAELYPIHPSRVNPKNIWYDERNYIVFRVANNNGTYTEINERDMLWLRGPTDDGYFGMSSVSLMQNSLGLDSNVARFLKTFYANQARPAMVLTTDQVLQKGPREELRRQWTEAYEGPQNAGKTMVLDRGLKVESFQQTFEAMELNDLRKMSRQDIAAFYRYPLSKLMQEGTAQGWDTMHAEEASYVTDCLLNEVVPLEQEITRQLMGEYGSFTGYGSDVQCHFETKGRLRGDDKTRAAYLQFRFNCGSISPNEVREIEDENPLDDENANKTFIQMGFVPMEMAGAQVQATIDLAKQKASEPSPKQVADFEIASRLGKHLTNGTH